MIKNNFKEKNGVTLVALVVTIIVLIILAGVSINLVIGERGILTKAKDGRNNYLVAANEEAKELINFGEQIEELAKENNNSQEEDFERLKQYFQEHSTENDLLNDSTKKFKNTSPILDAESSITYSTEKMIAAGVKGNVWIWYKNHLYTVFVFHDGVGYHDWSESNLKLDDYEVKTDSRLFLHNSYGNNSFSSAYVVVDGEKVNISNYIENDNHIDLSNIDTLEVGKSYKFIIIKDGKEYSGIQEVKGGR